MGTIVSPNKILLTCNFSLPSSSIADRILHTVCGLGLQLCHPTCHAISAAMHMWVMAMVPKSESMINDRPINLGRCNVVCLADFD